MTISKIFKGFIGKWKIKKILGHQGSAGGFASFTFISDNKLKYEEILQVKLENNPSPFLGCRTYLYEYENEQILKRYYENPPRLFYQLNFSEDCKQALGSHLCKADQYNANYLFKNKNHFTLSYGVTGPHKDYIIISEFKRILGEIDNIEKLFYKFY